MAATSSISHSPFDVTILRTPLLSYNTITELPEDIDEIKSIFKSEVIAESIFLASPELHQEMLNWINSPTDDSRKSSRLLFTLLRYLSRMAARSTPFGLFAGCSPVKNAEVTNLKLPYLEEYKKHARLDMDYLCALAQNIAQKEQVKYLINYYPNSCVYEWGERLRYINYNLISKFRKYNIASISNSNYVKIVLEKAAHGASIKELTEVIYGAEVTYEMAKEFIEDLIKEQVLISELEPTVTIEDFLNKIIEILENRQVDRQNDVLVSIKKMHSIIMAINNCAIGQNIDCYNKVIQIVDELQVPYDLGKLFHVDMTKPTENLSLSNSVINKAYKAVQLFTLLNPYSYSAHLENFKRAFIERYDKQEVALLEALDAESGIGYGRSASFQSEKSSNIPWNKVQSFLLSKYMAAINQNMIEVEITEDDEKQLAILAEVPGKLSDTFSVLISLTKSSVDKSQNFIHVVSAGYSSATKPVARFAHTNNTIRNLTRKIADKEAELNPEMLFAEIVHLPEARLGNILLRPVIRPYEIPYLAKSAVEHEKQISLQDIRVSVEQNRIVLRSSTLNKVIKPCLSSAHNFSDGAQPIYQFMCDVQGQDSNVGFSFNWGVLSQEYTFLPRVTYQNMLLFPCTWNLNKKDFEELLALTGNLTENVHNWMRKFKIPNLIYLVDRDNKLLINLKNSLSVAMFRSEIKNSARIKIEEFVFDIENPEVTGKDRGFVNEMIVSFYRNTAIGPFQIAPPMYDGNAGREIKRSFVPGEEWLYFKIYCGVKTADDILTQYVKPLVNYLLGMKKINMWFFIRYADPLDHLRLRFHCVETNFVGEILKIIDETFRSLVEKRLVWKLQIDTYVREIERYGADNMQLTEQIFFNDSVATCSILESTNNDEGESNKWLVALYSVNCFLDDFDLTLEEKAQLMNDYVENFNLDRSVMELIDVEIRNRYRASKKDITQSLISGISQEVNHAVALRSKKNRNHIKELSHNHPYLLNSYLHMHVNRLFNTDQVKQEYLCYGILRKYYRAEIARKVAVVV